MGFFNTILSIYFFDHCFCALSYKGHAYSSQPLLKPMAVSKTNTQAKRIFRRPSYDHREIRGGLG